MSIPGLMREQHKETLADIKQSDLNNDFRFKVVFVLLTVNIIVTLLTA